MIDKYIKINENSFKEIKEIERVYKIENIKEEKRMAEETKDRTIKECDEIITRCNAQLAKAVELGIIVEEIKKQEN